MSRRLKPRRGNSASHETFIGEAGEITVDIERHSVVVHDGTTPGGWDLRRDLINGVATIAGVSSTRLRNTVVQVSHLKALPTTDLIDGEQYNVIGYYNGSVCGGGLFTYKANYPQSNHDGGTVIAISAILNWSGDFADLPSFISWTGTGNGCFIRNSLVPFIRTVLFPEMFGAPESNDAFIDETFIHQKMWNVASEINRGGCEIQLHRRYPVDGLNAGGYNREGIRVYAGSGADFKRSVFSKGYTAVRNNQNCILRLGASVSGGDTEAVVFEGVTIDGRDFNFIDAMVDGYRLSQGSFRFCAFRRAKAPAFLSRKLEDIDFYNCNFGLLGGNDGRGAFIFTDPPIVNGNMQAVGNNAIRFNQGRFEFIDGPIFQTKGQYAWASTVTFIGTKFESGKVTPTNDPTGTVPTYGTYSSNYGIFELVEGIPNRKTVRLVAGCSFSGVSIDRCRYLFKVYKCDEVSCVDALISGSNDSVVNLFDLSGPSGEPAEVLNFKFKGNSARVYNNNESGALLDYVFTNKNKWAIDFEYPLTGNAGNDRSYKTFGKNLWYLSETMRLSSQFELVAIDDGADRSISPAGTVATNIGSSANIIMRINSTGLDGRLRGYYPTTEIVSLGVRAKYNGVSDYSNGFRLTLRDDVGQLTEIAIGSTVFEWHRIVVQIPKNRGAGLRLLTVSNSASAKVFIDAVELTPTTTDSTLYSGTVPIPSIAPGQVYKFTISQTGLKTGQHYLFGYSNASVVLGGRVTSHIPYDGALSVQIENLNSSTTFDAFTMQWKIKVFQTF